MFDQLTTAELAELNHKLHRGTIRTLDASSQVIGQMSRTSIRAAGYPRMEALNDSLLAAGSEMSLTSREVGAAWLARMSG